jgi:hypothetical protein
MISYSAIYVTGQRPYLAKVMSVASESYETRLSATMSNEELDLIPLSEIYSHLDNLVLHMRDRSSTLRAFRLEDDFVDFSTPIHGYKEFESIYVEAEGWFQYVFKNREPEEETPA